MSLRLLLLGRIYLVTVLSSLPAAHVIRVQVGIAAGMFGRISGGILVQLGIDSGIYP